MNNNRSLPQLIWGVALVFVGVSMFVAIPEKVEHINSTEHYSSSILFFIKLCFYLISILLSGGGIRKIFLYMSHKEDNEEN